MKNRSIVTCRRYLMEWSLRVQNYSGAGRLMDTIRRNLTQRPVRTRLQTLRHVTQGQHRAQSRGRGGDVRTREQESKGKRQQLQITGWIILSPSCVGRLSFISLHKLGKWRGVMKLGFWGGRRHAYSSVLIVSDELITYSFSFTVSNEFLYLIYLTTMNLNLQSQNPSALSSHA